MSRRVNGLRAWALQRLSALYLAGFIVYVALHLLVATPQDHGQWRDWINLPWVSISILLAVLMVLIHAWVGMRDVIMDYVHGLSLRVSLLVLVGVGLLACGLWTAKILVMAWLQ